MTQNKLFYEKENGEFYWVKETAKGFTIEWVAKYNCDSGKTPLDQNVKWGNILKVSKEKNQKHCLSSYDDEHLLIYPLQAGQPFYLTLATIADIEEEIADCVSWGVNADYYEALKKYL